MYRQILIRIRFGFLRSPAVHDDAHDPLSQKLLLTEDVDRVSITLTHLLAVGSGNDGNLRQDLRLGNDERLAIKIVELDGDIACDLDVLLLVFPNRNNIRIECENIRRHQDGIRKQSVVYLVDIVTRQAGLLVFVTVTAFQ